MRSVQTSDCVRSDQQPRKIRQGKESDIELYYDFNKPRLRPFSVLINDDIPVHKPSLTSGGTSSIDCPAKKVSKFFWFVQRGISQYDLGWRLLWRKSDQYCTPLGFIKMMIFNEFIMNYSWMSFLVGCCCTDDEMHFRRNFDSWLTAKIRESYLGLHCKFCCNFPH